MNLSAGNPFSTRHVQPGALEFLFPPGENADRLVERLRTFGWWGQLLGPHGAGKTTLLHTLRPRLEKAGRQIEWYTLRGGQRRLPKTPRPTRTASPRNNLIIVDGYEQLDRWARWQLKRRCRRAGSGLLVTSHADAGFPLIHQVQPSLPIVLRLVSQLLAPDASGPRVSRSELAAESPTNARTRGASPLSSQKHFADSGIKRQEVADCFRAWKGNVREVLFELYDLHETRCREGR
ncbi:MAG: hypothetical protein R6U98_17135 [Pirellulaceae bacterium]